MDFPRLPIPVLTNLLGNRLGGPGLGAALPGLEKGEPAGDDGVPAQRPGTGFGDGPGGPHGPGGPGPSPHLHHGLPVPAQGHGHGPNGPGNGPNFGHGLNGPGQGNGPNFGHGLNGPGQGNVANSPSLGIGNAVQRGLDGIAPGLVRQLIPGNQPQPAIAGPAPGDAAANARALHGVATPAPQTAGAAAGNPAATPGGLASAARSGEGLAAARPDATPPQSTHPGRSPAGVIGGQPPVPAMPASGPPGNVAMQAPGVPQAQTAAVAPPGNPQLVAAPPMSAQGATDARTIAPPAANDRALPPRADGAAQGHTLAAAPQRRARTGSPHAAALLGALGAGIERRAARDREREAFQATLQWTFWLLAIVAYACVGFALLAFLPVGEAIRGDRSAAGTGGTFAGIGLFAALCAWGLASYMARRSAHSESRMPPRSEGDVNGH